MKTLHLTNAYHPTSGGIREFYDQLLAHASRANHYMRLIVPWATSGVVDLDSHARIYRVRAPHSPIFDRRYRLLLPSSVLNPQSAILQILRDEQPDLIEVCDKYSLPYLAGAIRKGWMRGVTRPVLVGLSCERMDDNVASYLHLGSVGRTLSSLYMRHIYVPQFDYHVANSDYTAGELTRQAPRHPRHVQVQPMGVDIDRFGLHRRSRDARQALLERIGGTGESRVLVYAGRLSKEKNVGLLPKVVEQLVGRNLSCALPERAHDYRLVIAGTGPLADALAEDCARRIPARTTFLWQLDRDPLAELLANADVFIHPNPREPFGIAPLEAMASGLPLVAPTTGGVTTYASDETAWLAPAEPEDFARCVQHIFAYPDVRVRKTERALAVARSYRWERVARQCFDTYEQLVNASSRERAPAEVIATS